MFHMTWSRLVVPRFYNLHTPRVPISPPETCYTVPAQPVIVSESLPGPSPICAAFSDITLKACCLRCAAAACCLHFVSTVTVEDRRFGYGPVAPSHLVRGGPSPGPAGLAGLNGSSLLDPPGPRRSHPRGPSNDLGDPAAFGRGPQPWSPSADSSPVQRVRSLRHTRSLGLLRAASACYHPASDCKRQSQADPWRPGRFQRTSPFTIWPGQQLLVTLSRQPRANCWRVRGTDSAC
jgi:hypothetical protein